MVYQFLKILVGFTLKIFFRKIYISGTEHVQNNKAQLVASNHPNGFLEPLIMACFFSKDLHFLVRGDVFDNPFLKPLLIATHQIPIFRFRDGFSKLRENSQTMDESTQVLIDKKNLLIFAEGGTQSIKKLRPLQKGIARIAFQTLEKQPDLDLEILPVGINFTEPSKFNKEVMLE
ncbi:MAG: 1-acyl-sn-glycerol-3-phosphate acyltransferase [Saprospiraceae bacterium]